MHPVILDHPVGGGYGVVEQRGKRREGVGRGPEGLRRAKVGGTEDRETRFCAPRRSKCA